MVKCPKGRWTWGLVTDGPAVPDLLSKVEMSQSPRPPPEQTKKFRRAAPFSRAPQLKWVKRHSPQVLLREASCSFHCYPPVHPLCLYILKSRLTYTPHQLPWCLKGNNRASYYKGDRKRKKKIPPSLLAPSHNCLEFSTRNEFLEYGCRERAPEEEEREAGTSKKVGKDPPGPSVHHPLSETLYQGAKAGSQVPVGQRERRQ